MAYYNNLVKEEMFAELIASVKEGGSILRGDKEPSRRFHLNCPDIKRIRDGYQLTQDQFAAMLGISVRTLRNWSRAGEFRKDRPWSCCVWRISIRMQSWM
jgi:putative transcriptional regulator